MKFSFSRVLNKNADILICPVFEDQKLLNHYDTLLKKTLNALKKEKLFDGKKGAQETMHLNANNFPKVIIFVGLGKKEKMKKSEMRNTLSSAVKKMMGRKSKKIGLYYISEFDEYAREMAEGIALVNYSPAKYKTGKEAKKIMDHLIEDCIVYAKNLSTQIKEQFEETEHIVSAVNNVRDFVNGPSNIVDVDYIANEARKLAKKNKYSVTVFDKPALKKMGMGALLGVNAGSGNKSAKLVVLDYKPKGLKKSVSQNPILLVGKGLVFDSGGYNLKPIKFIEDMQQDKAGGSVVLGVFQLLAELKIKRRVVGIVPLTENLVDAYALKPADVLTSYSGKTIEIRNTDAEGRLILADALAYGVEKYKPEFVIDLATLTGACVIALGNHYAGLMGNDEKLIEKLEKAGKETDELVWHLPIHDDFQESMKGRMADLRNIDNGSSHLAGTEKAAAFLSNFVGDTKWAHIDIAGTAYNDNPRAYDQPMGTGYGVRLLIRFLREL